MTLLTRARVLLSRALDPMLHRGRDDRLSTEIETRLELLTEEYRARGMTVTDARAAARRGTPLATWPG